MQAYILKRLSQAGITLLVLSMVVFLAGRLTGNPCDLLLPPESTDSDFARCEQRLSLDKPIYAQYWTWLTDAVHGEFGKDYVTGTPVIELIKERFPNSVRLGLASMLFTTLVSLPLGLIGALKKNTPIDKATRILSVAGQSVPGFWLGIMLMWLFGVQLRVLPVAGMGGAQYYVLPVLTMGWWTVASQSRLLRSSMLEALDGEYIKLARIKGVPERSVVLKHALRNALIPVVTFMGMHFAHVVVAAMIAEAVFAWPGLGSVLYGAIRLRNFPVVQAIVLLMAVVTVLVNLTVDILYGYIDPRIRYD
jgi:peptide/nickel transport system permease protein